MLKIVSLPAISVIGKQGFCDGNQQIVADLWKEANEHFSEVAEIGMKEANGDYVGFWGAMSDETMSFKPWTNDFSKGYYLAGIEVYPNTPVPQGWTMWTMPARKYLIVDISEDTYQRNFMETINHTIPANGLKLIGAVCDYTKPATGQNSLFFPVENE